MCVGLVLDSQPKRSLTATQVARFDDPKMLKRFAAAQRSGTYLRIAEEGELQAGDSVEVISRPDHDLTIAAFAHAFLGDRSQLGRLLIPEVSQEWREWVAEQAAQAPFSPRWRTSCAAAGGSPARPRDA